MQTRIPGPLLWLLQATDDSCIVTMRSSEYLGHGVYGPVRYRTVVRAHHEPGHNPTDDVFELASVGVAFSHGVWCLN